MEILSYAFYKEEIERMLRILSKQAKEYLDQNAHFIDSMKSMIEYDFKVESAMDKINL